MPEGSIGARQGRKYDQVIEGARAVFLRDGFEGASVDDIAREAGVSKATLYSYFPDKRQLFSEMVGVLCRRQAEQANMEIDFGAPPAAVLPLVGRRLMRFILSPTGQRLFRICVAETDRFPELGAEYYRCGPQMVQTRLRDYLLEASARCEVRFDDANLAAAQFAELCRAELWAKVIFGVQPSVTEAEIARTVDGATLMFLARYGC